MCRPGTDGCFDYTAFDAQGRPAVQGVFVVESGPEANGSFSGSWQTVQLAGGAALSGQAGTGSVTGIITETAFSAIFQSALTGAVTDLDGDVERGSVRGVWSQGRDDGELTGLFEAIPPL